MKIKSAVIDDCRISAESQWTFYKENSVKHYLFQKFFSEMTKVKNRENVILADTKLMCTLRSIALFLFSMLIPSRVIFMLLGERSILLVFPLSFAFYLMVRLLLKRSMVPSLSLRISDFLLCIACLYAMGFFIEPNSCLLYTSDAADD